MIGRDCLWLYIDGLPAELSVPRKLKRWPPYEGALVDLQLMDRNDPLTELIAKAIVNVTATGERDPENIKDRALNALGVRRTAA